MPPPSETPIGITLSSTAKAVSRAFDESLNAVGGSRPAWLILLCLKTRSIANQRDLAAAIGIRGATLTHHLTALENAGLLTRRRDPDNRRVHLVELTDDGDAAFRRMREAAISFDRRLRAGVSDEDIGHFRKILGQLHANAVEHIPANTPDASTNDTAEDAP